MKLKSLWVVERDGEPLCYDDTGVDFTSFTEKSEAVDFAEEDDVVVEFRRVAIDAPASNCQETAALGR